MALVAKMKLMCMVMFLVHIAFAFVVANAAAKLEREWDETMGYYYVLEVTVPEAGEVEIGLRSLKSPKAPFATTQSEMAAFQEKFRQRPSRFPQHVRHTPV